MDNNTRQTSKSSEIDLQWFIVNFLIHWKWFALSLLLFLFAGFVYLRYVTPVYRITSTVVLKDSKRGGLNNSAMAVFEKLGYLDNSSNVENEIEVLCSRNLVESVIAKKNFYINYVVEGTFRNTELFGDANRNYYSTSPVKVFADAHTLSRLQSYPIELKVSYVTPTTVKVKGKFGATVFANKETALPAVLQTPAGEILVSADSKEKLKKDYPLTILIQSPLRVAQGYIGALRVGLSDKNTTVVRLSLKDTHQKRGEIFLENLIDMYNRDAMDEKDKAARGASQFITDRLAILSDDLQQSENLIEEFKQANNITNIEIQSRILLTDESEYGKKLIQLDADLLMLSYLETEVKKADNTLLIAPLSTSGAVLLSLLEKYNQVVLRKGQLTMYMHPEAKELQELDERLRQLKVDVLAAIVSVKASLNIQKREIQNVSDEYGEDIQNIPRRERQLEELVRQQMVQSALYIDLLKRKESIDLTLAATAPSAKVLENPMVLWIVSPQRTLTYLLCLLFGFFLPFLILGLFDLFKFSLTKEEEIRNFSDIPVIVSLPQSNSKNPVVVSAHATSAIVERFRLLRVSLQSLLDGQKKKSILITSTISGEGKTFVSLNLAMAFALKYKTLLIGLDIRRPKLAAYLDLAPRKGLISYLTGETKDIDKLVVKNFKNTKLDVLLSGVVPPNPNELLMEKTLDELFEKLREQYDYIIIDSSPAGSVSDTFLLNRVSDVSLFVVRKGVSPKSVLSFVKGVKEEAKLKNIHLVLNAFDDHSGKRYGYGYGYGYSLEQ